MARRKTKRQSRVEEEPEPKPDLTPMIDIVFNLIIFFMIVSELNNLSVEELQLSFAESAAEAKVLAQPGQKRVLQVNVLPEGLTRVNGVSYSDDPLLEGRYPSLQRFLELEAAAYETESGPAGAELSALRVNLRADKEAPFVAVQRVFGACQETRIYKTSLAATKQSPGAKP